MPYTFSPSLSHLAQPARALLEATPHAEALAIGAYIFSGPRILLLRRAPTESWANRWEVPGGGAEVIDTTLLDTVVREVKEETGLDVMYIPEVLGFADFTTSGGLEVRKWGFVVEVREGMEVRCEPSEHSEYRWCTKEDVGEMEITTQTHKRNILRAMERVASVRGCGQK
jgi:8-oxo-dGTP diphosphatase